MDKIGEILAEYYVSLRSEDIHTQIYHIERIVDFPIKSNDSSLPVIIEIIDDCQRKTAQAIRALYSESVGVLISACRKQLGFRGAIDTDSSQKHMTAMIELLGCWSNMVADITTYNMSTYMIQLVVFPFHSRIIDVTFDIFLQYRNDKNIDEWTSKLQLQQSQQCKTNNNINDYGRNAKSTPINISVNALDNIINTILSMSTLIIQYKYFILNVFQQSHLSYTKAHSHRNNTAISSSSSLLPTETAMISNSSTNCNALFDGSALIESKEMLQWREVDNIYIILEIGYFHNTMEQIFCDDDELQYIEVQNNVYTFQMLEDYFFVINRILNRSVTLSSAADSYESITASTTSIPSTSSTALASFSSNHSSMHDILIVSIYNLVIDHIDPNSEHNIFTNSYLWNELMAICQSMQTSMTEISTTKIATSSSAKYSSSMSGNNNSNGVALDISDNNSFERCQKLLSEHFVRNPSVYILVTNTYIFSTMMTFIQLKQNRKNLQNLHEASPAIISDEITKQTYEAVDIHDASQQLADSVGVDIAIHTLQLADSVAKAAGGWLTSLTGMATPLSNSSLSSTLGMGTGAEDSVQVPSSTQNKNKVKSAPTSNSGAVSSSINPPPSSSGMHTPIAAANAVGSGIVGMLATALDMGDVYHSTSGSFIEIDTAFQSLLSVYTADGDCCNTPLPVCPVGKDKHKQYQNTKMFKFVNDIDITVLIDKTVFEFAMLNIAIQEAMYLNSLCSVYYSIYRIYTDIEQLMVDMKKEKTLKVIVEELWRCVRIYRNVFNDKYLEWVWIQFGIPLCKIIRNHFQSSKHAIAPLTDSTVVGDTVDGRGSTVGTANSYYKTPQKATPYISSSSNTTSSSSSTFNAQIPYSNYVISCDDINTRLATSELLIGISRIIGKESCLFTEYKSLLSTEAFTHICLCCSKLLNELFINEILSTKFNEWGSFLVHEEVFKVIDYIDGLLELEDSGMSSCIREPPGSQNGPGNGAMNQGGQTNHVNTPRMQFSALINVLKVLTLDQPSDVKRYLPGLTDMISVGVIRKVLDCRIDFSKDAVIRIKLD